MNSRSGGAGDGAAARPFFDAADVEHRFTCAFQSCRYGRGILASNDDGHSDAAIEGPGHFLGSDASALLKQRENRSELPAICVYRLHGSLAAELAEYSREVPRR